MLILSRRIGESIVIGEDVIVTVLKSAGNQIRLGIAAPGNVPVHREEIFDKITQENAKEQLDGKPIDSNLASNAIVSFAKK
ncbi:carbon storage regulator CsrA [Teredinibacter franksiae]|uniref:carbon storage regulator CsrA n=1 Tax=Teredinibacter franksiae TaxID=2761453 RepID=UPI00162465A9|nr:carbon storage regulator CsrA [Teredinibacter franksiae]